MVGFKGTDFEPPPDGVDEALQIQLLIIVGAATATLLAPIEIDL